MRIRLNLKIVIFIIIFIFTNQIEIYGVLMLFALIHELGHMLFGILLKFKPDVLEIMPFGISVGFKININDYNKKVKNGNKLAIKKAIIALGGPITNAIIMLIFLIFPISLFGIDRQLIVYANILIGLFNLIPIYPLDGGRVLKNILHINCGLKDAYKYTNIISNISIAILTAISSITILYLKNIAILLILGYLWYLVISENKKYKNKISLYEKLEQM